MAKYPKVRSYADTYGLSFVSEAVRDANDSREAGADEVPVEAGEPGVEDPKRGKKVGPPFLGRGKEAELMVDNKGERIRRKETILKADTAWDRTVYAVSRLVVRQDRYRRGSLWIAILAGRIRDSGPVHNDDTGCYRGVV